MKISELLKLSKQEAHPFKHDIAGYYPATDKEGSHETVQANTKRFGLIQLENNPS